MTNQYAPRARAMPLTTLAAGAGAAFLLSALLLLFAAPAQAEPYQEKTPKAEKAELAGAYHIRDDRNYRDRNWRNDRGYQDRRYRDRNRYRQDRRYRSRGQRWGDYDRQFGRYIPWSWRQVRGRIIRVGRGRNAHCFRVKRQGRYEGRPALVTVRYCENRYGEPVKDRGSKRLLRFQRPSYYSW